MTHENIDFENTYSENARSGGGRRPGSKNRPKPSAADPVAAAELRQFVERLERLEEERKAIGDDIKDVFAELHGRGFDKKTIRKILRIRKQDESERQEEESILEIYMAALDMAP